MPQVVFDGEVGKHHLRFHNIVFPRCGHNHKRRDFRRLSNVWATLFTCFVQSYTPPCATPKSKRQTVQNAWLALTQDDVIAGYFTLYSGLYFWSTVFVRYDFGTSAGADGDRFGARSKTCALVLVLVARSLSSSPFGWSVAFLLQSTHSASDKLWIEENAVWEFLDMPSCVALLEMKVMQLLDV